LKTTILSGRGDGKTESKEACSGSYRLARYEKIAVEIAEKIVRKEYRPGEKLYGRSTLAGQYNVSPETIRRAVALLQSVNVVVVEPGRGIIVGSREAAAEFLKEFEARRHLEEMRNRINALVEERNRINREIDQILGELISYTVKMTGRLYNIEEAEVEEGSFLVGKSLASSGFRSSTGATVLAMVRDGKEIFSPDVTMEIKAGDILVFVGPPDSKSKVEGMTRRKN